MKINKLSAACIACAGMIFCCGFTGVKPSPETEAVKLLQKSAEKGNDVACYFLGKCYEKGFGVKKNILTALGYYRRCAYDSPEAAAALNKFKIAPADIKFTYTPEIRRADGKNTAPKITFSKPGKVLLSIEAKVQNLCFVEEVWADKDNNKMRFTFTPYNFEGKDFDWRTKLLDLKGDGDFRYLIIADYHTGSSSEDMKGYVIDVKDNYKHIATISVGEAFDLPYHNPKLIFEGEK